MSNNNYFNLIDFGSSKIRFAVYDNNLEKKYSESKFILPENNYKNHFNYIADTVKRAEKKFSYHIKDIILLLDSSNVFTIDISLSKKLDNQSKLNKIYNSIILELNQLILKHYNTYNILHIIIDKCLIDNKIYDKLPKNEYIKSNLKIDFKIICLPNNLISNLKNKFIENNLNILNISCSSYIKSNSYKEKSDQKKISFLDIGWERTSLIFYENNKLKFILSVPIGSNHITKDISKIFKINLDQAEKIKKSFNKSDTEFSYHEDFPQTAISAQEILNKKISIDLLKKVILYRVQEIMDLIYKKVNHNIYNNKFENTELILIGEGSVLFNNNSFYLDNKFNFNSIKLFNEEDSQICKNGLIHHLNNFKIPAKGNKKQGIFEKFFNIFSN